MGELAGPSPPTPPAEGGWLMGELAGKPRHFRGFDSLCCNAQLLVTAPCPRETSAVSSPVSPVPPLPCPSSTAPAGRQIP